MLFSKKESCGKKGSFRYFIGYNDNVDISIKLPQMIGYAKYFERIIRSYLLRSLIKNC